MELLATCALRFHEARTTKNVIYNFEYYTIDTHTTTIKISQLMQLYPNSGRTQVFCACLYNNNAPDTKRVALVLRMLRM